MPKLSPYFVPHSVLRLCFLSTSSLRHSQSQPQSLDEAVDSFTRMLSMRRPPSIIQFTKILGSLAKTNHFPTAISLFQQLQARGIAPNLFTLSILINCCCGMGCVMLAFSVLAKIFRMGFQPDTVTLNTLIKGGRLENARHIFQKLFLRGYRPDIWTYNIMINELCKKRLLKEALAYLSKMEDNVCSIDIRTYNIIIYGLCEGGRLKSAQQIFQKLFVRGYRPDVWTFTIMVNGLCKEGLLDEALALKSKMKDLGCSPNKVTNNIISRYLKQVKMTKRETS
ncbi:hypothetical protein AHAS_Ahas05G0240800 [Arachis hypogaea]